MDAFRTGLLTALALVSQITATAATAAVATPKRPYTLASEIGTAWFGDPNNGAVQPLTLSPNGAYVAVHTERGLLAENKLHDEIRVYALKELRTWLNGPESLPAPPSALLIRRDNYKEGPLISDLRWLGNSDGLIFRGRTDAGNRQVWVARLTGQTKPLTPESQDVTAFDVRDENHFIYAVRTLSASTAALHQAPAFSGTGLSLWSPIGEPTEDTSWFSRSELWSSQGGAPRRLVNPRTKLPIVVYEGAGSTLRLSPDGTTAAVALPLENVPASWPKRYLRPGASSLARVRTVGGQNLDAPWAFYVEGYALIEVESGIITSLAEGPTANAAGWDTNAGLVWSADGRKILLPGAFVPGVSAPCVAIIQVSSNSMHCLEKMVGDAHKDYVQRASFASGHSDRVEIEHCVVVDMGCRYTTATFAEALQDWRQIAEEGKDPSTANPAPSVVDLEIRQDLNDPPVLWARDRSTLRARLVWDPNPQLKDVQMTRAVVYRWADAAGTSWSGGLYLPSDNKPFDPPPLVVQTHGFLANLFRPSGIFPEGYAARALAASGIAVIQVPDCPNSYSGEPDEAPCHVRMYQAVVRQLTRDALVDSRRIGIVGFSRTCLHVMQALTERALPLRAALITDGVNHGYLQYLLGVDASAGFLADFERPLGGPPWGRGLQRWLKRSPEFNLEKVDAPLQVVAAGVGISALTMWEPYALLRAMHKPVDFLILNTHQHPTSQPAVRLASQGDAVDWFRFWLQGYEDPEPSKAEQYRRWETMCEMQIAQHPKQATFCVRTTTTR